MTQELTNVEKPPAKLASRSVMGPVLLIAAGVLFLLDNLGVLPALNWTAALRYWPLLLILLGLNVLVVQARPPAGTLLSLLVTLLAIGAFGFLLLTGAADTRLGLFGLNPGASELRRESFDIGLNDATSAEVTLNLGPFSVAVDALDGGNSLVSGTIATYGNLDIRPSSDAAGRVAVVIGEEGTSAWFLDPRTWGNNRDRRWQIALNPDVPLDLRLSQGFGSLDADLAALDLAGLRLDGGNGSSTLSLPPGDYDIDLNPGNGSLTLALPSDGKQSLRLDGANGGVRLFLPEGVEARVEYNEGNGNIAVDDRFERVSGDRDAGVYETAGYDPDAAGILMRIDSGNGGVTVSSPR